MADETPFELKLLCTPVTAGSFFCNEVLHNLNILDYVNKAFRKKEFIHIGFERYFKKKRLFKLESRCPYTSRKNTNLNGMIQQEEIIECSH